MLDNSSIEHLIKENREFLLNLAKNTFCPNDPAGATKLLEKTKVKRQNCDHNHTEILTALVLYNKEIQIEDILNMVSPPPNVKCSCEDFIEYKEDLSLKWSKGMTHQKRIKQYLENLKDKIKNTYFQDNVEEVFVCGKNNKYDEIDELNKNLNKNNKKDARADIYIKLKNGKFIGLSVKSNEKDALCNISVYKTFSPEHEKQSIEIKNNFLTENGFGVFNENDRPEINKLFKENLNNPVFNDLREKIDKYNQDIKQNLVMFLNGNNLNYDLWEYNGTELYKLNKSFDNDDTEFYECAEYYLKKNGQKRNAAKMFYKLYLYTTSKIRIRYEL